MNKTQILLVEDDENFGSVLKSYLEINNFEVDKVNDGQMAFPQFEKKSYDLVLLDVMLPNKDGFEIAKKIRSVNQQIPFIFITAKTLHEDIVRGYRVGADDYITKPFDSEILLLKMKAVLNRAAANNKNTNGSAFQLGDYQFDYQQRRLLHTPSGQAQSLSPKEAELLQLLVAYQGEVMPKKVALKKIWGEANYFTTRSMDVYITKLRKHLLQDEHIKIITLHGAGYRILCEKNQN